MEEVMVDRMKPAAQRWIGFSTTGIACSLGVVVVIMLLAAQSAAASQKSAAAIFGSLLGDETSTRLLVDFDAEVRARTFHMAAPARIVVEFDEVSLDFSPDSTLEPRGLVSKISYGRMSQTRSRIVLELTAPAEIVRSSLAQRIDEDSFRLVLDLDAVDDSRFAALAQSDLEKTDESSSKDETNVEITPQKDPDSILILLDPGHGGIDGGAVGSAGTVEKDLVLEFSQVLREQLLETGLFVVKMTRQDDRFVSLRERVNLSKTLEADLFLSVHADSLRQRFVRGSTIYTLSNKASDRLSEELANSENSVDLVAGLSMPADTAAVTDILADLTTRETKSYARKFSRLLREELETQIRLIKNPERYAAFGVLKAPEVPGVLLELGYLSNKEDEMLLTDETWQKRVASAVTKAIVRFFEAR